VIRSGEQREGSWVRCLGRLKKKPTLGRPDVPTNTQRAWSSGQTAEGRRCQAVKRDGGLRGGTSSKPGDSQKEKKKLTETKNRNSRLTKMNPSPEQHAQHRDPNQPGPRRAWLYKVSREKKNPGGRSGNWRATAGIGGVKVRWRLGPKRKGKKGRDPRLEAEKKRDPSQTVYQQPTVIFRDEKYRGGEKGQTGAHYRGDQ